MGNEQVTVFGLVMGKRLQEMRENLHLTQKEVADALGISNSYISKCERGVRQLQTEEIAKLCATYKVNYGYFFAGEPMHATMNMEGLKDVQVEGLNKLLQSSFFRNLLTEKDMLMLCKNVDVLAPFALSRTDLLQDDQQPKEAQEVLANGFAATIVMEAATTFATVAKKALPGGNCTKLNIAHQDLYKAFENSQALFAQLYRGVQEDLATIINSPDLVGKIYPRMGHSITQASKANSDTDRKGGGKA